MCVSTPAALLRRGVLERPFQRWHRFQDARKKRRAGRVTVYDIVEWL